MRSLVTDHSLPSATDRALPLHASSGHAGVAAASMDNEACYRPPAQTKCASHYRGRIAPSGHGKSMTHASSAESVVRKSR
jgi:hypothetical protein